MIKNNILETIGNTPIVKLNDQIMVKVESFNPGGSVKDRVAYKMIQKALEEGSIDSNTTIIEPTSGNTGVGLAMVCAALHLKCILVMPSTMSIERRKLMRAYGAEVILSDGNLGMKGAIAEANHLHDEISNSFIPMQFENKNNPLAHYESTAIEILKDSEGEIDIFVAGIGTGGTISGVGRYLKENKNEITIIGVEPRSSAVITTGIAGKHKIQGIGAGFIPQIYDSSVVDQVMSVSDEEAYQGARELAASYGILAGISGGAAYFAAKKLSLMEQNINKKILALLPDTGERYLSGDLFEE